MTRLLLDVNVVLDVLAAREPFVVESHAVFQLIEAGPFTGLLAAHSVTTVHSLLSRHLTRAKARRALEDLLRLVTVVAVDEDRLRHALAMNWRDFDDAVQASCAGKAEADYLVTRDKRGFKGSVVRPVTPAELLALAG